MPLFRFECADCHVEMEILVRGQEGPVCTACGSTRLQKQLSHIAPMTQSAPEFAGCGAASCCQMQGGGCGGMN